MTTVQVFPFLTQGPVKPWSTEPSAGVAVMTTEVPSSWSLPAGTVVMNPLPAPARWIRSRTNGGRTVIWTAALGRPIAALVHVTVIVVVPGRRGVTWPR